MIPDLIPLDWSLEFGGGRLSPTLQPPKQVCGSSAQPDLPGALAEPSAPRPPAHEGGVCVCWAGVITRGVLGRARGSLSQSHNAFLKMEPPLAPPSLSGSRSWSPAGWAWLSRGLALAPWVSGPRGTVFISLLGFGAPGSMGFTGSACLLVCLTLGLSESLSLVFWVPVFLGVCLSPPLLTFLVLTEVGKCRQRCQAPWPPKKPLPHSFLHALEWCGRGQEMGCAICLARAGTWWVGSALPQVPTPSSSTLDLDTFLVLRVL